MAGVGRFLIQAAGHTLSERVGDIPPSGQDLLDGPGQLPLMVLSLHPEEQYAVRAFRAGAMAYLTKHTAPEELARAVKQVLTGQIGRAHV